MLPEVIFQLFQQRQYAACLNELTKTSDTARDAQYCLYSGLCYQGLNRFDLAEQNFCLGLKTSPADGQLLQQLILLHSKTGKYAEALKVIESALTYYPGNVNLLRDKASALGKMKQTENALSVLKNAKDRGLGVFEYLSQLADIHRQAGSLPQARQALEQALKIKKTDFALNYQLGCVYRDLDMAESALERLFSIYPQGKTRPELNYVIGCCFYDLSDFEQAETYLNKCLEVAPYYIPAHESLSKLHWERGAKDKYIASYQHTNRNHPPLKELEYSKASQLLLAGNYDEALETASYGAKTFNNPTEFIHLQGVILSRQGEKAQSFELLQRAALAEPHNARYQIDIANRFIREYEYLKAEQALTQALEHNPDNQELWAFLGLAWRLNGNPRHQWLNDYDNYVRGFELPVPARFSNREDFLSELNTTVGKLHKAQNQPLDQSVRGGSQTDGHLLHKNYPILAEYRSSLEEVINRYLHALPDDSTHPLCRRNTGRFNIAGSWSVSLPDQGFHANHVHPLGWLSGPTYLNVPQTVHKDDPKRQGWVKFGETSLDLGAREEVAKAICPEPGLVVLFPSYIWHGTYPFCSDEARITLPSDISPRP